MTTPYHARYFAHELTRQPPSLGVDRLSASLFDAAVDLNPHQIDAALFALRSPLGSGVLLADEVGLGKTIEAGLVLCQLWAERRRRLLVVCPAALRKQWALELTEKFNLPTLVLDAVTWRRAQREGQSAPFGTPHVVIVSYQYASALQAEVRAVVVGPRRARRGALAPQRPPREQPHGPALAVGVRGPARLLSRRGRLAGRRKYLPASAGPADRRFHVMEIVLSPA